MCLEISEEAGSSVGKDGIITLIQWLRKRNGTWRKRRYCLRLIKTMGISGQR